MTTCTTQDLNYALMKLRFYTLIKEILNQGLNFKEQIEALQIKCLKTMNILTGTWQRSDSESIITAYKSYVRSIIEYKCFIFFLAQKALIFKLERVQDTAIRLCQLQEYYFNKCTTDQIKTTASLEKSKISLLKLHTKNSIA